MATLPRESTFLPTIKCSTCGRQIEISLMGDHLCGQPEPQTLSPATNSSWSRFEEPTSVKTERLPPRVDTNAANGGYMRPGQLTPVSTSSGSRSLSPRTPDGRSVGSRSNDFFEPTIASDYDSTASQDNRRRGYGGFSERDDYDVDPLYPPSSPKRQQPTLSQRMNTIAPGPFDVPSQRGAARNRLPSRDAQDSNNYGRAGSSIDRPGTAASNRSGMSSVSNNNSGAGAYSLRAPRKNGYGGFGPPQEQDFEPEPFSMNSRSGTFPSSNNPAEPPTRTPSAPGPRPDRFRSRGEDGQSSLLGPDTSRPPPPRNSLVRPRTTGRGGTPSVDLAAEFGIGNPYHAPSASISSAVSSYSQNSTASPPRTASRRLPPGERKPSDTSNIDDLMSDLQASMSEMQSPPQLERNPSIGSSRRGRSRDGRYPSRSRSASRPRQQGPASYDRPTFDLKAEVDRFNNAPSRDQSDPGHGGSLRTGGTRNLADGDRRGREMPGSYGSSVPRREPSRGPQPYRGICKACGEEIRGKSISSADGRLTGKYHKACFVCTTCREPFTSTEFYVLNDKPYCELHYHQLNGSLCGSCGRGIEGQYLEDESLVKYHVGCFRCADCGMSLSNGYFEVDGKSYCEPDAWRRVQQTPSMANGYGLMPDPNLASPISDYSPARTNPMSPMTPAFPRGPPGPFPPSPASSRGPPTPMGLPQRPGDRGLSGPPGPPRRPIGLPRGQRLPPGMGPVPRPRMNKRMTRLGMM